MIPVFSTHDPVKGGNCFSAALATVTNLPIEAVPQFYQYDWDVGRHAKDMENFKRRFDIGACKVEPIRRPKYSGDDFEYWSHELDLEPFRKMDMFWVATGGNYDGGRVFGHAVVYYNDRLVHDPAPLGCRIEFPCDAYFFKRGVSDSWICGRINAIIDGWYK